MLGRVTNEQFRMLSADYNAEQKELAAEMPAKEEQLEKLRASAANVDSFIEKASRHTVIDHLTPELLRLFIQRIEIEERTKKYSRSAVPLSSTPPYFYYTIGLEFWGDFVNRSLILPYPI